MVGGLRRGQVRVWSLLLPVLKTTLWKDCTETHIVFLVTALKLTLCFEWLHWLPPIINYSLQHGKLFGEWRVHW